MHQFSCSISICGEIDDVFRSLTNLPVLFSLNPQWDVRSHNTSNLLKKGEQFNLNVKYDRTDEEKEYNATIDEINTPNTISIDLLCDKPRRITFNLSQQGDRTRIDYLETRNYDFPTEEKRELIYWLKSIGNYHLICKRKTPWGRLWRWFVDRCWLKMSPAGRRMVFIIVFFELLTLLLLLVFIIIRLLI